MSSPAVNKAPPKLGSKTGTPARPRKASGSSAASKPSVTESTKSAKKTPRKLTPKAPEPMKDDQSIPETPSPKPKKSAASEQRLPASPDVDENETASQVSGSAAPLGRAASGVTGKAKGAAGKAKESAEQGASKAKDAAEQGAGQVKDAAEQGAETVQENVPLDLSALKGLEVSDGGKILGEDGNPIGQVVEGDPEDLVGQTVGDDGEILDEDGDVIGRVDILHDAAEQGAGQVKDAAEQGAETVQENVPLDLSALKGLEVSDGGKILGEDGNPIGQVVEGDPEDLVGQTVGDDGEILDEDGDVIGRVDILHDVEEQAQGVPDEAQPKFGEIQNAIQNVITELSQLQGLPVADDGAIKNQAGQTVGRITEGNPEDLVGYTLNDEGEVVDDDGDAIGRAELVPVEEQKKAIEDAAGGATEQPDDVKEDVDEEFEDAEDRVDDKDAAEDFQQRIPDINTLEGLTCNKRGYVIDQDTGKPVGELVEGDPKKISRLGATLDDQGQFWDNRGNVIGKVKALPVEDEHDEEGPFAGLEGLVVGQDGWIVDENQTRVGKLVDGDAKKLIGRAVDEDGEILDRHGSVIGRAERYEEPEPEEEAGPDLSVLNGLSCNKAGYVIGPEGFPIARVVEGNPKQLAGKKIEDGEIYDGKKVVGRVELIPEDELESKPEGLFAGMESLVVTKDGFVEDEEGSIVGKLIEGDPKKLRGHAVDEDGEITDKYGNVKGRAEPYEPPEEEAPAEVDLSILEGKVVNKNGNVVDPATGAIFGRIVEGDKRLAGRKVDGKGQIWGDNGQIIGRAELIPGAEEQKPEGPFYGFDNAEVGKDGVVKAGDRIIGRLVEGDAKRLLGRKVDEDGDVLDKNGNTIGKAERWEPEEKKRDVNPMSGRKVTREGEVRDADGNLIGKLTSGNLATLIGKTIDDNGYVVDNEGNKIGECTLLENIPEPEEEGPSAEEQEAKAKADHDRELAGKMSNIVRQTLEQVKPVCNMITEYCEKADRTPKEELDEEKLVQNVKPLLEEGGRILQECNGAIRALDPDGRIAATAKARASSRDATPEEYQLADMLKELTETVVKTIDNGRKRIADMPHAKKKLNPLWGLLSEPLFQIIAAVGLLLNGVLSLVGRLLDGLGLGGLLNGLLGGLGLDKLISGLGLGGLTDALGLGGDKK